jgi:hypothetical protein
VRHGKILGILSIAVIHGGAHEEWGVGRRFSAFAVLLFIFFRSLLPAELPAAEAPFPGDFGAAMPAEKLHEIIERNTMSRRKTWGIRLKEQKGESSPAGKMVFRLDFFQKAGAWILRGILVLGIAALILAAGIYGSRGRSLSRNLSSKISQPAGAGPPPPSAILEEARRLYRQGLLREAWGRCYAAALGALGQRWGLRFPPGATEYRCLALVRRRAGRGAGSAEELAGPVGTAFAGFIRRWVDFFYGGILPPEGAFEEALAWIGSLCEKPIPNPAAEGSAAAGPPNERPFPGEAGGIHG